MRKVLRGITLSIQKCFKAQQGAWLSMNGCGLLHIPKGVRGAGRMARAAFAAGALLLPAGASAIPGFPGFVEVKQPDGSVVKLRMLGDERCHVTVDELGRAMTQTPDGFWRPTQESGIQAMARLKASRKPLRARTQKSEAVTAFPRTGEVRSLIILVDFPDINFFTPNVRQEFDQMLNLPGFDRREHIGSAADYFREQSMGQFSPRFDVYGPVRADRAATYYGENDANGDDMRAHELVMEVCRKLDGEIDFADYDLDGDGMIDNVYLFYAGYGENFAGNKSSWIWPHANHIATLGVPEEARTFDGKILNSYGCCAELYGTYGTDITAIGTFCHEFGHILGLPDTYDVNYAEDGSGFHPDFWDVMAAGSYLPATRNCGAVPAGYNAMERWLMGWADPVEISRPQAVTLPPLHESGVSARISTSDPDEFFILENRQQTLGSYDRFLPSHGMLVWHVDRRKNANITATIGGERKTISCADAWSLNFNAVNANASHQCLEIEKAGGNGGSKSSLDTPFPGRQMITAFNDKSPAPMTTWDGKPVGKPVTDIREQSGRINFNFMGGATNPVVVEALEPDLVTASGFTARWAHCPEAEDGYRITLYKTARYTEKDVVTLAASFRTVPADWTLTGDSSPSGNSTIIGGGSSASTLTSPEVNLSLGGTLTIRAAQAGSTAATLTVKVGDTVVAQYLPTEQPSDYTVQLPSSDTPCAVTLSVARRKSVALESVTLRQDVENVELTLLPSHTALLDANTTSHTFEGLELLTPYAYRVEALGFVGSGSQLIHTSTTSSPDALLLSPAADSAPSILYRLDGTRLGSDHPSTPGIYLRRTGNRVEKVVIR